jgi:hypothetical protein
VFQAGGFTAGQKAAEGRRTAKNRRIMARTRMIVFAAALAVSCTASLASAQDDTVICRGPGFYQTHSGGEKETANVGQEILEAADGIDVCGHHLVVTDDLGGLDSALEGLCVRTQGERIRQLYRQLITTAFNCLMSEGGSCDEILDGLVDVSFSDCDDLCAGDPQGESPTIEECIENLDCFNSGGRMIEGECATGTCDDDGETLCEEDDDCEDELECVRFEDSCANSAFCSEELDSPIQICPKKGAASSPKTCKIARKNGCTIDDFSCYESCSDFGPCVDACEATPGCDPEIVCDDGQSCYEQCLSFGFGDGTPCGCENSWAIYCNAVTGGDPLDFYECLLEYESAEANGFCTFCEIEPLNCLGN